MRTDSAAGKRRCPADLQRGVALAGDVRVGRSRKRARQTESGIKPRKGAFTENVLSCPGASPVTYIIAFSATSSAERVRDPETCPGQSEEVIRPRAGISMPGFAHNGSPGLPFFSPATYLLR
jgi:hypothetical protein